MYVYIYIIKSPRTITYCKKTRIIQVQGYFWFTFRLATLKFCWGSVGLYQWVLHGDRSIEPLFVVSPLQQWLMS